MSGHLNTLFTHHVLHDCTRKCYMGFCTPRRTVMESKKKKKNIREEITAFPFRANLLKSQRHLLTDWALQLEETSVVPGGKDL